MPDEFQYDVFLKAVVQPLAEPWHAKAEGKTSLQRLAFSLQPLSGAPIKGSLAQFLYINWHPKAAN